MAIALDPGLDPLPALGIGWLALGVALLAAVVGLTHQGGRAWSAALLYVALGLLAAAAIDALGVSWLDPVAAPEVMSRLCEVALALALFANGVRLDRHLRVSRWGAPIRLLAFTMPLSVAAIALLAGWAMGLGAGAAIVLGAALAPTDPVLAGDVGESTPGEQEPEPEFAITAEASLNDGLIAPLFLLGIVVAEGADAADLASWAAVDLVVRVLAGLAAGAAVGALAGRLVPGLRERERITRAFDGIFIAGLALVAYGAGEILGGYGFLAAFAGGLAFRRAEAGHAVHGEVHEGALRVERLLEVLTLLLVFSSVTATGLRDPGVAGWALAIGSVLLVRPIIAYVSLLGAEPRRPRERLYVAWFGVRGVGTLFYAAAALASGALAPADATTIWWTAVACVLVSIVVHGVTSGPASRALREG